MGDTPSNTLMRHYDNHSKPLDHWTLRPNGWHWTLRIISLDHWIINDDHWTLRSLKFSYKPTSRNASAIFPRCEQHYNRMSQLPLMRPLLLVGRANRAQSFAPCGEHLWSSTNCIDTFTERKWQITEVWEISAPHLFHNFWFRNLALSET